MSNDLGLGTLPAKSLEFLTGEGFAAPSYGGKSLSTVLPAIVSALGHDSELDVAFGSGGQARGREAQIAWGVPSNTNVCLVIVDGLGFHNINDYQSDAPYLSSLNSAEPATAGFPSTTATSMSVLGTGSSAGLTGMVGYSAVNPMTGDLGNFVSWRNLPEPKDVQRQAVLFESLTNRGVLVESIGLKRYNGSDMTVAALRGPRYTEAETLRDTFKRAARSCVENELTHVYWAEIDKVGHHNGVGSRQWRSALREFDKAFEAFVKSVPQGTHIVLTADHGMINVDMKQRIDVARNFALSRGLRGLGGEPRCTHVYFNSKSTADAAKDRWVQEIGDGGLVLTRDEVVDLGLYGPVSYHVAQWIGHLMVLAKREMTLVDSDSMAPMAIALKGVHGSLTDAEVRIPGISFTV